MVIIVVFVVLINNFYKVGNTCSWCKYLSCLVSDMPSCFFPKYKLTCSSLLMGGATFGTIKVQ